ncbi:MAG: alpha-L-fucosidase [Bacteroidales bacterium]|nr:alpha-L-fucosidase [Bacteroidales bacterium]
MKKKRISALVVISAIIGLASCVHRPERSYPIPTANQLEWQQLETYAFIHFGLNTFNNMEWGYGDTPASTFNPTNLDCEQWVLTLKNCGMKGVIFTAKHHDGFCLWPTETTDYSIKNSPYKNGKGDLVKELSEACRKHGLKFGIYVSPWDRHQAEYGKEGYVDIYHKQIEELTSNYGELFEFWFDGANGGDGWYGGANETRSIVAEEYYNYEKARDIVWSYSPNAAIFGGTKPTLRWIGNEKGIADATQWCMYNTDFKSLNNEKMLSCGFKNGTAWLPAEVDVSIRPGWFYHKSEDSLVKTVSQLLDLFYNSVGHNANLLLNFPVNTEGRIPSIDSANAVAWYQKLQNDISNNLLKDGKVTASDTRGSRFNAKHVLCDEYSHYWATHDGVKHSELIFEFPKTTSFNRLLLQEYIPQGQNVDAFYLDYYFNGKWLPIETDEPLTTIGYKRLVRFQTVKADKLRIRFKTFKGTLCINKIAAYCI